MSFESDLNAFLNTASAKKGLQETYIRVARSGTGSGITATKYEAIRFAEDARLFIIESLPSSLKVGSSRPITANDLILSDPRIDDSGKWIVEMWWNPEAVHRDSLWEDSDIYDKGIEDIVRLFANGYHARNYVYGWWDGHSNGFSGMMHQNYVWCRSKRDREPDDFLQQAIIRYNSSHQKNDVVLRVHSGYLKS